VYLEIRKLVKPWLPRIPSGERRVSMELLKLGFEISERTVSRLMPKGWKPTQSWMTFLRNHVGQLVSIDFFTVATIRLRVLYVRRMACRFFHPCP
jgi:putative transposase